MSTAAAKVIVVVSSISHDGVVTHTQGFEDEKQCETAL